MVSVKVCEMRGIMMHVNETMGLNHQLLIRIDREKGKEWGH